MKNLILITYTLVFGFINAQEVQDLPWEKNIADREFLPYQKVREADVLWPKRLRRIIDIR